MTEKKPKTHRVKIWPRPYEDQVSGIKPFEYRIDDRGYQVGDFLHMEEWNPETEQYTGRSCLREVTYILGRLPGGYVVMATRDPAEVDPVAAERERIRQVLKSEIAKWDALKGEALGLSAAINALQFIDAGEPTPTTDPTVEAPEFCAPHTIQRGKP